MRQTNCWSSDHRFGQNLASRAFHLQSLQPRIGHPKLFRTRWTSILWTGLPQFVQSTMCLLQRCHFGCTHFIITINVQFYFYRIFFIIFGFNILQKCVTALDKTWHTEHFFCAQCGQQFGEEGFHERDGKPYCRNDYFDMFAPKCNGCNRAIMENYISALNSQWHPDCFVCRVSNVFQLKRFYMQYFLYYEY